MACAIPPKSLSTFDKPFDCVLQKANQIANYCATLATMLNNKPLFNGTGSCEPCSKVISLAKWDDARICDIFNKNAALLIGTRAWPIHQFGCGNSQLFDRHGNLIQYGLFLALSTNRCTLEELAKSYQQVYEKMVKGWVKADLQDHPTMLFPQNPKEFDLFIKTTSMIEESALINSLVSRFSLTKDVRCSDVWMQSHSFTHGKIYLWIRKSALPNVIEKIGLKFTSKC